MKPDQLEQPVVNFGSAVVNISSRPTHRKQLEKQESPAKKEATETAAMATAVPMKLTVVDEVLAEEEDVVSLPPVTRPAAAEIPGTCTAALVAVENTVETWASVESDPEDGALTREGEFEKWYDFLVRKVDSKAESVISDEKVAAGNGDTDQREPLFGDGFLYYSAGLTTDGAAGSSAPLSGYEYYANQKVAKYPIQGALPKGAMTVWYRRLIGYVYNRVVS